MEYIGEHLLPGKLGHLAIFLAFSAAFLSALAYYFGTRRRDTPEAANWKNIGRGAFLVHGLSVFSIIGIIFFLMINRYYEYQYVQAHTSDDLAFRYIFSAFWEGQEGSFLLWMFWHVVLGVVLMRTAGKWESPVMSTLSLVQVFLMSMILGVYIGWGDDPARIGSNPLMLLRNLVEAPIFNSADYLNLVQGNGLNPLLQNYWMTIHPPTLFLGFASTVVPFCFAVAGLWLRDHRDWMKPALKWALFSGAILGLGILMGGAWAYEALTFGGYWAWDPVENMSLVPWLMMVAGIHANLVGRNSGYSIKSAYIFYILSFLLVLYSTFLTRSGILGETSVHAFTEMGLEWQLIIFMAAFLGISIYLLISRNKGIPVPEKEEATASREFWMFIGALVLLFSSVLISGSTSLPVFNKIVTFFNPDFKPMVITDQVPHYNKYQLWIGVLIGLLSGAAQFMRYREPNWPKYNRKFLLHAGLSLGLSVALTALSLLWIQAKAWQYWLLLLAGWFAIISNLDFLITFIRGKMKLAASAFSHLGFGVMLIGILASGLNKQYISSNPFLMDGIIEGAEEDAAKKNIMLFKGVPMPMSGYQVTYVGDTIEGFTRTYTVNLKKQDADGKVSEEFNLHPNILYDKGFTKIAAYNPYTKRYVNKDIFTHITGLPEVEMDAEARKNREKNLNYKPVDLYPGAGFEMLDTVNLRDRDTFDLRRVTLTLEGVNFHPVHPEYDPKPGDIGLGARIRVTPAAGDTSYVVAPALVLRGQLAYTYPAQINELSMRIKLDESAIDRYIGIEGNLDFKEFRLKQGESAEFNGMPFRFAGVDRKPQNPGYVKEENDIAVGGLLEVTGPEGKRYLAQPVYYIRGAQPMNIRDYIPELGLYARFVSIDPATETMTFMLAQREAGPEALPVDVATNSFRSDFIVFQAIIFPGINLFWIGSLLMLSGLGLGLVNRLKNR